MTHPRHRHCKHMRLDTTMALFEELWAAREEVKRHLSLEEVERRHIRRVVTMMRPQATWAEIADVLGTTKVTLYNKRQKYDIDPPEPTPKAA